jgi:hypothetical protein
MLYFGRLASNVIGSVPMIVPSSSTIRNTVFALASVFAPVDFLLLFGSSAITRKGIVFLTSPFEYLEQLMIFTIGLLFIGTLMVHFWVTNIRACNRQSLYQFGVLFGGLLLGLMPVLLFTEYSEIYNYIPSAFGICLIVKVLIPESYVRPGGFVRRYGVVVLIIIAIFYGVATFCRNILLSNVTIRTQQIALNIVDLIPQPKNGSRFLFLNQPWLEDGYSLYGLEGVNTFESFGTQPVVRLLYDRQDLTGKLVKDSESLARECLLAANRPLYVLVWTRDKLRVANSVCGENGH